MKTTLSLVTILSLSLLHGSEFQSLGGLSTSMGGAGVASASGSLAGYYNPALLTQKKGVEISLGVGAGIRENNIGESIDKLSNMNLTDSLDRIGNNAPNITTNTLSKKNTQEDRDNIQEAQDILKNIGSNNGISLMPSAYLGVQYDNMSIGVYSTSDIAVSADIDTKRTGLSVKDEDNGLYYNYNPTTDNYTLINQAEYERTSLQYALDTNLSTLKAQGLATVEVPISYAQAFELPQGELSVGGSLKLIHGTTYTQTLSVDSDNSNDSDTLNENKKESDNIGIDVGLLFKPSNIQKLQVGLVAKNLNSPSFDTAHGKKLKADLQLRTGLQYRVNDSLDIAGDLDLTSNKTLIPGYDSQMLGGGLNYHPLSWFAFRGGLMQNLANSNDGVVYTAGLVLGPKAFQLDMSAQMASKSGSYDGNDIPKYAKVNVALVSKW